MMARVTPYFAGGVASGAAFREKKSKVPTLHVPNKRTLIKSALSDADYMVNSAGTPGAKFYRC